MKDYVNDIIFFIVMAALILGFAIGIGVRFNSVDAISEFAGFMLGVVFGCCVMVISVIYSRIKN